MNPHNEKYNDVVELCALLQCLGFSVKSLDASDGNLSQDGGVRTVVVNCQSSGLHVVLESGTAFCSCPEINQQNSGCWHVSGISGGKPFDKEFQTTLLSSIPKAVRDRVSLELNNIMQTIRQNIVAEFDSSKDKEVFHKSASMVDLDSPTKRMNLKVDTPTRYRSLDNLAANKEKDDFMTSIRQLGLEKKMCIRQSTYTLSSTPESALPSNKTSSPINAPRTTAIESLLEAEKAAEELRIKLSKVIKQLSEDCKESSVSSLALDVSKISMPKNAELSKAQYVSSPNLSATMNLSQGTRKNALKIGESLSTSNLAKSSNSKQGTSSKLPRISPNIFKKMKDSLTINPDKEKTSEHKPSKLNSLFKNKASTQTPKKTSIEAGPSPIMSKKRFSHIKTTIPKPTPKK